MITNRLEKNVTAGTEFKYEGTEDKLVKLVLVGNVGDGAMVDCRKCVLEIHGDIGNDVTLHSLGAAPLIIGKKGRDLTHHKYNKSGECLSISKIGVQDSLVLRGNSHVTISVGLIPQPARSFDDLRRALSASAQSTSGPLSALQELPSKSSTAPLSSETTEEHKSEISITLVGVGGDIKAAPGSNVSIHMSAGASSHMFAFPGPTHHGTQASVLSPEQPQKLKK